MLKDNEESKTKLSSLFSEVSPNKVFFAIVFGSLSGLAYSLMIPLVLLSLRPPLNRLMKSETETPYFLFNSIEITTPKLALTFFILCFFIFISRASSEALMVRLSTEVTKKLRMRIYKRISLLPIQHLELIGPSRLLAAITGDIPRITNGAAVFPDLLVNIATLVGLLGFLLYLNVPVFVFIVLVILLGIVTYQIPVYFGGIYMSRARNRFDHIHESIRGLIYGAKELKINQNRKTAFMNEELLNVEDSLAVDDKRGKTMMVFGLAYGNLISFFAIGFVTYAMANYYVLSLEHLTAVVMVMLYITGPISALVNSISPIVQANVSVRKLDKLLAEMPIEKQSEQLAKASYNKIIIKDLEYKYPQKKGIESEFSVGPIDLTLNRGEIVFLVGGNGSGKTTLAKMLSLHYLPTGGQINFDNLVVTNENRDSFRQLISSIYTNYYLFTRLFSENTDGTQVLIDQYIKDLKLEGKVKIENGKFSGTSLSDGQKKRLALLVAYLEDRDIYVFDEWAADQDPIFRDIFYYQILPRLKKENKLVIVISHDDRYFNQADKIIRMENGKVSEVSYMQHEAAKDLEFCVAT